MEPPPHLHVATAQLAVCRQAKKTNLRTWVRADIQGKSERFDATKHAPVLTHTARRTKECAAHTKIQLMCCTRDSASFSLGARGVVGRQNH